jgi:adenine-specific DNA-methyltransferase
MPTLDFKGKPFVYSHHLSVPFRGLEIDAKKSMPGPDGPSLDDNLIIHGDNLHALKALLPKYAGKVDVIYIDPPYNTGNEGWVYNDNVNSPLMKEWLGDTVDGEDLERHDKWLCMMWPRVTLLKELLTETGAILVNIDDTEVGNLRLMLDEIFGSKNFISNVVWQKKYSPQNDAKLFSAMHDHILIYAKDIENVELNLLPRTAKQDKAYKNPDNDSRGPWKATDSTCNKSRTQRPNLYYEITNPNNGDKILPLETRVWRYSNDVHVQKENDNRVYWGKDGSNKTPAYKSFLTEVKAGRVPTTIWDYKEAGHNQLARQELNLIFDDNPFDTPKPTKLLEYVLKIFSNKNSLILDSFAGSGTTGHAVKILNSADGGQRKFILVETEHYADEITAERIRRVSDGIPAAKDENHKKGLGGSFTFCNLGAPIDVDSFFAGGEGMPKYDQIASYIAYTATGEALAKPPPKPRKDWFIGEVNGTRLHLIYKNDADFMKSGAAALTEDLAKEIAKSNTSGKTAYVFGAVKYLSQKELSSADYRIQFCQLPYSIYRIMGDAPGTE